MRKFNIIGNRLDKFYVDKNNDNIHIVHITYNIMIVKKFSIGINDFGFYLNFIRK